VPLTSILDPPKRLTRMFAKLVITDHEIDAGAIAEALVYYGKVTVAGNGMMLAKLISKFGYDNLVRCFDLGIIEYVYTRSMMSVQHEDAQILFDVGSISLAPRGTRPEAPDEQTAIAEDIAAIFARELGP
jgi:hypothetical protein